MTYEQRLMEDLKEGPVCYYDKRSYGRRVSLLDRLEKEGKIIRKIIKVDDQESYMEVRLT